MYYISIFAFEPSPLQLKKNKKKEGKEGNVLFNNAPNTFYLRLYGVDKNKKKMMKMTMILMMMKMNIWRKKKLEQS